MRSNNDRRQMILAALANPRCTTNGAASADRVRSFLGYPYCFEQNLADLVSEGSIATTAETLRSGRTRRAYRLA